LHPTQILAAAKRGRAQADAINNGEAAESEENYSLEGFLRLLAKLKYRDANEEIFERKARSKRIFFDRPSSSSVSWRQFGFL